MSFIEKNIKIILLVICILIFVICITLFFAFNGNNDGMINKNILDVTYRTYTKDWTKYTKNGITSGNKVDPIQDIEIKIKDSDKGKLYYSVYTSSWSDQIYDYTNIGNEIKGIKIGLSDTYYRKYDVCYRTYNKEDKWLNWTCNSKISGNKKESITAIEIKIIPKNIVKFDYLKDFNKNLDTSKGF